MHWTGTTYTEILDWTQATNNSNHAQCKISYTDLDKDPLPGMCHVTMPKAYSLFRATGCRHLRHLCSPRTITWTLKMQRLWNVIPADTPYLRKLGSLTRRLMGRFYAVIPQLPSSYLGNYRPMEADSCNWLIVIICCYYYLEATRVRFRLRSPGTSWYSDYDF